MARDERSGSDEVRGWSEFDPKNIVRLISPFSWNFAEAFETIAASEPADAEALLRSDLSSRERHDEAYCEAGCSTVLPSVPESGSMVLLGTALLILGAVVRRRVDI